MTGIDILVLLTLFQIKHFVADYPLQTPDMIRGKGILFNPYGILHSMHHSLLTIAAFLAFGALQPVAVHLVLLVAFSEFFIHYFIDWSKMQVSKNLTPKDKSFWNWMGFDQLLHQLTYLGFVWILII